jgi:hypothetical protein
VEGICYGEPPVLGLPAQALGTLDTSRVDWAACSDSRRQMRTGWRSNLPKTFVPVVHRCCPHNELAALVLRAMGQIPQQVFGRLPARTLRCWRQLQRFCARYDDGAWSHLETAESYAGALRRRYVEAARSLADDGLSGFKDYYLRPFLKAEKNRVPSKMAKPRLIYPRSPRFNLELASRLKPFEHWLWGRLNGRVFNCGDGSRLIAKGLSPRQRANLIVRKFSAIRDCVCFEIDGKAFEAHVGPSQLEQEHATYLSAFRGDKRLAWLLGAQLKLLGNLSGARFSRLGCRASGDFNTGLGNSLIFLVECISALRGVGVHFDLLVDGDNALLFVSKPDLPAVLARVSDLVEASSGHEIVLERPTSVIEEIRFGGSAPVYLGPRLGWRMVREWHRVLSSALSSHIYLREPKFARRWMSGVAQCELSLARGVPILQEWAVTTIQTLGPVKAIEDNFLRDYSFLGASRAELDAAEPVAMCARISFEKAFGVDVETQMVYELSFRLRPGLAYQHFSPISFDDWIDEVGVHETWRQG